MVKNVRGIKRKLVRNYQKYCRTKGRKYMQYDSAET